MRIIQSARSTNESIMEFEIAPGEKTPIHYHTLFSETFEILKGTLEVSRNSEIIQLKKGDRITIKPYDKHHFNNTSEEECVAKITISPGNLNFENSLLIFRGLVRDGLSNKSGIPKRFSDLALFVFLNNSRMVGFQKVAEPLFNYIGKAAIKKGRLEVLLQKYGKQTI